MCKTTTPPRPSAQDKVRQQQPNSAAGAVIPLQSYLNKYSSASAAKMVPPGVPPLPHNVRSTNIPISLLPLLDEAPSSYYAGVFDDEMHFSASLLKVAALFAAAQIHADVKASGSIAAFDSSIATKIQNTADPLVVAKGIGLVPATSSILKDSPTVAFLPTFMNSLNSMIGFGTNEGAAACITALGYGYISSALITAGFFDVSKTRGIWLAGTYVAGIDYVRIHCENDHDDAQVTTTRQMLSLFTKIWLDKIPSNDEDANSTMQDLLSEPKPVDSKGFRDVPWLAASRGPGVAPLFKVSADKIGVAGLGSDNTPQVYSEGLIIQWKDSSKIDDFNKTIDPTNANSSIHLSGEIAVCWQNLLAELITGGTVKNPMFDPIIDIVNDSLSDFFHQAAL